MPLPRAGHLSVIGPVQRDLCEVTPEEASAGDGNHEKVQGAVDGWS